MIANRIALWLAQGLGIGRIPIIPGTFGSGLGFLWFLLIAAPNNFAFFATAILLSFFVSVLCAEIAEKILNQHDPNSIVIDEIVAIPICFLGWMAVDPTIDCPMWFFTEGRWKITLGILFAFRVFDIWKPWPVRQSQRLPGGWGVTVDDILAAIYVAVISGLLLARH
ncbi:MAG TPA: phosphatidylglycerophosphatase A [Verrucomicrobiae bacterium]|nr:phosphatidylglycerophosphatase A [Verrucomicrobiae bacterium]